MSPLLLLLLIAGITLGTYLVRNETQLLSKADELSVMGSPSRTSCDKELSQGNFLNIDTNGCGELSNVPNKCSEESEDGHKITFTAPLKKDGQWVTVKSDGEEINEEQIRQKLNKDPRMGQEGEQRTNNINAVIQPELINCNLFVNYSDDTDCDVLEPVFERDGRVMERMIEGESYTITLKRGANDRSKPREERAGVGCRVEMKVAAHNSTFAKQPAKPATLNKIQSDGKGGVNGPVLEVPFGKVGIGQSQGKEGDNPGYRTDFTYFIKEYTEKIKRIQEDERIKKFLKEEEQKTQATLITEAEKATKAAQEANEAWLKDKTNPELAKKASDETKKAADAFIAAEALRKLAKLEQMLAGDTKDQCVKADLGMKPWLNARRLKLRGEDTREDGSPGEKVNRYLRLYVCSGSNGTLKWRVATEGNDNTTDATNENSMERILRLHADSESTPNYPSPHYPFDELEHQLVSLNGQEPDQIREALSPYIEAAKAGKAEVTSLLAKAGNDRTREGQKAGVLMTAAQQPGLTAVVPLSEYVAQIKDDCTGNCPDTIVEVKHIYDQSMVNIPEYTDNDVWKCIANSPDSVENSACGPTSLAMIAEAFNGVDESYQTANNLSRFFLSNKLMNCTVGTIDEKVENYAILNATYARQKEFHLNMQELVSSSDSFEKMEEWFRDSGYPMWAGVKFAKKSPHYVAIVGVSDRYVFVADPYYPGGDNIFKFEKSLFKKDYYNGKFWKVTHEQFNR